MTNREGMTAGPIGRTARVVLGVLLLLWAGFAGGQAPAPLILRAFGTVLALLLFYLALHWRLARSSRGINPWLGLTLANGPAIAVFLLGLPGGPVFGQGEGALAVLVYAGVSLLVAGWRADAGCEVMSLPGLVLGRHTRLPCIVLSPIDAFERKIARR